MGRWMERLLLVMIAALLGAALARFTDEPAAVVTAQPAAQPAMSGTGSSPTVVHSQDSDAVDLSTQLVELEQMLAQSRDYQRELEERVAALELAVEPVVPGARDATGAPSDQASAPSASSDRVPEEVLLQAGISADVVSVLRDRLAENEMAKLYLRDQALREGWEDTPEYAEALAELNAEPEALRREFGDDVYDRYLYATGQPNRVMVSSTLVASPAQNAGIEAGDLVMRYGDQRILTLRDLRAASASGEAGEPVSVELRRDGSSFHTTIPRGPLGVRLDLRRVEP